MNITTQVPSLHTSHLLRGDELTLNEIMSLITFSSLLKQTPHRYNTLLSHNTVALILEKPSLRTRFSFGAGIQAADGIVIESTTQDLHGKKEQPKDMIRVLQGYCDALILRTHKDEIFSELVQYSNIPIINGLSEHYHPCQILSDLCTIHEHFGYLKGIKLCYVGDHNNILNTFMLMAPIVEMELHYSCPTDRSPPIHNSNGLVVSHDTPQSAVAMGDVVYTDVWNSMGSETQESSLFEGYQVNETLMGLMKEHAVFMHCLPMERGKETNDTLPDSPRSLVFPQSHNRMYMQLALLSALLTNQ